MKTTFSRTFATVTVILLAALMIIGTTYQRLSSNYLAKKAISELEGNTQVIREFAQAAYSSDTINNHDFIVAMSMADALIEQDVVIFDAAGKLLMCSHAPLGCEHLGLTLNDAYLNNILSADSTVDTCVMPGLYEDTRYVVSMPITEQETGTIIGIVMVSTPTSRIQAVLERITEIYVYVSLLVAVLGAVMMTIFARWLSEPLSDLADTARAFGHGDLKARVKVSEKQPLEMQELSLAFNNMACELEKSEYQRQEFVANVSHELKTPMTTISGYVDGILDGTIPENRQRHYLQVVSDETKRLNRLVRSMLDISKLQDGSGIPEEQKIHFDLCECIGRVLITFEQKINAKKLDVQVDMPEHSVCTIAHQDYVTQVIYNLVDNAVKFCPEGGVLALQIQESGAKVYVSVSNDSSTIPPEELPLVFDRFHKIDKSRSQNRDSWGLGLYIVKTIICSHGEDISVTSRDGRTTFTFTRPLVN